MTSVGCIRMRVTVFLVSMVTIMVEIALMRELALRFWDHLAWLVISIALLGFGTSGTLLVLLRRFSRISRPSLLFCSLLCLSLSIPLCLYLGGIVDLDLVQMVWQPAQFWRLGILEFLFALPFICGGMYIGLALQDDPVRVPGHYGASFIGSGMGGILVLPALFVFSSRTIMLGCSCLVLALALYGPRDRWRMAGWLCGAMLLMLMIWQLPRNVQISADKDLPQLTAMPGSTIVARRLGPQGLVQIVQAPAFHTAPGLSLNNAEPLPDQLLVTIDGAIGGSLYRNSGPEDFAFLDNTTMALPYHLDDKARVLIGSEAGISQVGLSLYHGAEEISALATNRSLAQLKMGELAPFIGHLYRRPEISFFTTTLRAFLSRTDADYSLIDLGVTGEDFGGLKATTTAPLFTLDTFGAAFDRLEETGMLMITTQAHVPPRESLRLLNIYAELLHSRGLAPRNHIVVIRSWATVTLVAARAPITAEQRDTVRSFCRSRGFDLVWLPDLELNEVNRHHRLDEPHYYLGASNLLGDQGNRFVERYIYDLTPPDDGKPFFHHFSRSLDMGDFSSQLGRRGLVYMEIGKLLLAAALGQTIILALILIVLPMVPAVGLPGARAEQLLVLAFFSAIGFGFMLLEMGLLQRLDTYLGHPIYAAASVISGFLFFGGLGSILSSRLKDPLVQSHFGLGLAIATLGIIYLLFLDTFLAVTGGFALPARLAIVLLITCPVALLMGMMFPLGLKRLGLAQADLIPWAWSVNGFTSVLATLLAPMLAMHWGFGSVVWSAAACYGLAALFSLGLPSRGS